MDRGAACWDTSVLFLCHLQGGHGATLVGAGGCWEVVLMGALESARCQQGSSAWPGMTPPHTF